MYKCRGKAGYFVDLYCSIHLNMETIDKYLYFLFSIAALTRSINVLALGFGRYFSFQGYVKKLNTHIIIYYKRYFLGRLSYLKHEINTTSI